MLSETRRARDGNRKIDPSEYLGRTMKRYGINARELGHELDVHPQTIYNVTSGNRRISSKLAVKLALKFGEPVEFWLGDVDRPDAPSPSVVSRPAPTIANLEAASDTVPPTLERRIHALAHKLALKFGDPVEFWLNELDLSEPISEPTLVMSANSPAISAATSPRQGATAGPLVDRQLHSLLDRPGSGLSIHPFDPCNVQPASYDLTVGLLITKGFEKLDKFGWGIINKYESDAPLMSEDERQEAKLLLEEYEDDIDYTNSVHLRRGDAIGVVLREEVRFGSEFLARVGGTTRHAASGLLIGHGLQIDPGYHGPIIVTAMNIGLDEIELMIGQKMVSLEIVRLDQRPDAPYQRNTSSRIARIVERLRTEIAGLFDYEEIVTEARFITTLRGYPDEAFVSDGSIEEARWMAVARLVNEAERGDETHWSLLPFKRALNLVIVDQEDAEALIRLFPGCPSEAEWRARESFKNGDERTTLNNLFKRLELDSGLAVARLIGALG